MGGELGRVDGDALGAVVRLVDAHQPARAWARSHAAAGRLCAPLQGCYAGALIRKSTKLTLAAAAPDLSASSNMLFRSEIMMNCASLVLHDLQIRTAATNIPPPRSEQHTHLLVDYGQLQRTDALGHSIPRPTSATATHETHRSLM